MNGAFGKGAYSSKFRAMEKEQIEELRKMMNQSELNQRNQRLHKETNRRCRELAQRRKQLAVREERRRESILARRRQEIRLATEKFQRGNRAYSPPPPGDSLGPQDQRFSARPPYIPRRQRRGVGTSPKSEFDHVMSPTSLDEALRAVRGDLRPHSAFPLFGSGPLTRHNSMQSIVSAPPDFSSAPSAETMGRRADLVGGRVADGATYSQMRSESLQNVSNGRSLFEQKSIEQAANTGCQSLLQAPPTRTVLANQYQALSPGTVPTNQHQTSWRQADESSAGDLSAKDLQSTKGHIEQLLGVAAACQANNNVKPTNQSNAIHKLREGGFDSNSQLSNSKLEVECLNLGQGDSKNLGQCHDALSNDGRDRTNTPGEPSSRDSLEISERSDAKTGHQNQEYSRHNLHKRDDARSPISGNDCLTGRGIHSAETLSNNGVNRNWSAVQSTYQYVQASARANSFGTNQAAGNGSVESGSHSYASHAFEPRNGISNQTMVNQTFIAGTRNVEHLSNGGIAQLDELSKLGTLPNLGGSHMSRAGLDVTNDSLKADSSDSSTTAAVRYAVGASISAVDATTTASRAATASLPHKEKSQNEAQSAANTEKQSENNTVSPLPLESAALVSPRSDEGLGSGNRVLASRGWQSSAFYLHQGGNGARNQTGSNVAIVSPSVKITPQISDQASNNGMAKVCNLENCDELQNVNSTQATSANISPSRQEFRIDNLNANFNTNSAYVERQSAIVGYLFADAMNQDTVNIGGNYSSGKKEFAGLKSESEINLLPQNRLQQIDRVKNEGVGLGEGPNEVGGGNIQGVGGSSVLEPNVRGDMRQDATMSAWQDDIMQESKLKHRPPDNHVKVNSRSGSRSEVGEPLSAPGFPDDVFIDDSSSISSTSHVDDPNMTAPLGGHRGISHEAGYQGGQELKGILKRRPASSSMVPSRPGGLRLGPGAGVYKRSLSASGTIRDSLDVNKNLIKSRVTEEDEAGRKKSVRFADVLCSEEPTAALPRPGNIWSFQQQQQTFLQPHPPSGPRSGRAAAGLGLTNASGRVTGELVSTQSATSINSKTPGSINPAASSQNPIKSAAGDDVANFSPNHRSEFKLDRTPTDDDINRLWEQVREGLDRTPSFVSDTSQATPTDQSEQSKYAGNSRLTVNGLVQNPAQSLASRNGVTEVGNQLVNQNSRKQVIVNAANDRSTGKPGVTNIGFIPREKHPPTGGQSGIGDTNSKILLGSSTLQQPIMKPNAVSGALNNMGAEDKKSGQNGLGGVNHEGQTFAPKPAGLPNGRFGMVVDENGNKPSSKVTSAYGNNYMGSSMPTRQKRISAEMLQRYGRNNNNMAPAEQQNNIGKIPVYQHQLAGGRVADHQTLRDRVTDYTQQQGDGGKLTVYQQQVGGRVNDYQNQGGKVTGYLSENNGRSYSDVLRKFGSGSAKSFQNNGQVGARGDQAQSRGVEGVQPLKQAYRPQSSSYVPMNVMLKRLERDRPTSAMVNNYTNTTESLAAFVAAENLMRQSTVTDSTVERAMRLAELRQQTLNQRNLHNTAASAQQAPTALSIEENRLLQSLEKLNDQLKIHENNAGRSDAVNSAALYPSSYSSGGFRGHQPLTGNRVSGVRRPSGLETNYTTPTLRYLTSDKLTSNLTTPSQRMPTADRLTMNLTTPSQRMPTADRLTGYIATPSVNGQTMVRNGNQDVQYSGNGNNGTVWYPNHNQYGGMRY